jgi:putative GTP pyrophosphokinase
MPDKTTEDEICREFQAKKGELEDFREKTVEIIEGILRAESIVVHSVGGRVKSEKKLLDKYKREDKDYRKLDDIKDQVGIRIITYYEDQVDPVSEIISREFQIIPGHSVDRRNQDPDRFGYQSVHHVCTHSTQRLALREYRQLAGIDFELQIRSILQHAWAEMEHDAYDRGSVPRDLRRRFSRLAGLLELADSEFIELRKKKTEYENSVALRVNVSVPDISDVQVNEISIKAFVEQDPLVKDLDKQIATLLKKPLAEQAMQDSIRTITKGVEAAGLDTLQDIRSALSKNQKATVNFAVAWIDFRSRWSSPLTSEMAPGYCLAQLTLLLVAGKGTDEVKRFSDILGRMIVPEDQISDLVNLAISILEPSS